MRDLLREVPMPSRIACLPRDPRGYPIPWFVAEVDGVRDFRVADGKKLVAAVRAQLCWICGDKLGRFKAFVIGPMCAVNRTSAEPPSHLDCAVYAARVCPFMVRPGMRRNEKDLPERRTVAGAMIRRNPGVALVWVTTSHRVFSPPDGSVLFDVGEPHEAIWYAEGRAATRAEVEESITSGLPEIRALCATPQDLEQLAEQVERATKFLPSAEVSP